MRHRQLTVTELGIGDNILIGDTFRRIAAITTYKNGDIALTVDKPLLLVSPYHPSDSVTVLYVETKG